MAITTEFSAALRQVSSERGIKEEEVLEAVKSALLAAYRKDYGDEEEVAVKIDPETGKAKVFKGKKDVTPPGFGRIATQTAKQVILQKVREAEKEALKEEYQKKVGEVVSGYVFRARGGVAVLDLGRTQGLLLPSEQIPSETYEPGQQIRVLIKEVKEAKGGTEVIVSRKSPEFVKGLFLLEVPELSSGAVEIKGIAREAGRRTKIAVSSKEKNVDPVGSMVGRKGVRVQAVTQELGEEKVDIVEHSSDPQKFIVKALSPAKVLEVELQKKKKRALVRVPQDQISLAIGKGGQNVRLAGQLAGWRIDIQPLGEKQWENLPLRVKNALLRAGITSFSDLKEMSDEEILALPGIGKKSLQKIKGAKK